ncbi:MAG: hypothetical protein ACM3SW_07640 [Actinomycetota bacterium]
MAQYSQLSKQDIEALDRVVAELQADPNFIAAIANVVTKVVPAVVRATPQIANIATAVTPAVVGGAEVKFSPGLSAAEARVLSGKLTAQDLIELRNKFASGS